MFSFEQNHPFSSFSKLAMRTHRRQAAKPKAAPGWRSGARMPGWDDWDGWDGAGVAWI